MTTSRRFQVGNLRVELLEASIASLPTRVDAIVSPDDNHLSHGGGASAAIWAAAGGQLTDYVNDQRPELSLGSIWVTPAGSLEASHVVHAITIDLDDYRRAQPRHIAGLYKDVLEQARQQDWKVIAFPLLGAGAGGQLEASCQALATALSHHGRLPPPTAPELVLVALQQDGLAACIAHFESRFPGQPALATSASSAVGIAAPGMGLILGALAGWAGPAVIRKLRGGSSGEVAPAQMLSAALETLLNVGVARLNRSSATTLAQSQFAPIVIREGETFATSPALDRASLGELVRVATEIWATSGSPLPEDLKVSLNEAVQARNRLVHSHGGDYTDDVQFLVAVAEKVAAWLAQEAPSLSSAAPAAKAPVESRTAGKSRSRKAAPAASGSAPHTPRASGTQPVHRLHKLLLEQLPSSSRKDLLERLDKKRFTGPDDLRILEYCAQAESLEKLLTEEFAIADLRRILKAETGVEADGDTASLASQLLEHFGFPPCAPANGLRRVMADFEKPRRTAPDMPIALLRGEIAQAVSDLERILKLFLHFLCRWLFSEGADSFLRGKGWLESTYFIERLTTGKLVELINLVDNEIETSIDVKIIESRRDLPQGRLLPDAANALAAERNKVIHVRDGKGRDLSDAETRTSAKAFLDKSIAVLGHLQQAKTFPVVIRIESIKIDGYGRRIITALSDGQYDEGRETLFTDAKLAPGELYLMRPFTNPWRVDPVLIPAGDLGKPAQAASDDADGAEQNVLRRSERKAKSRRAE